MIAVIRVLVIGLALVLGGLVIAWMVTRDRKHLANAWRVAQGSLALVVILGLLYVLERLFLS